jgi:hypothetical protein
MKQQLCVAVCLEQRAEDALVPMPMAFETPVIISLEQPGDDFAVTVVSSALDLLL